MNKICTKCGINKILEDFYKDARAKNGKTSTCKICINKYYVNNKQRILKNRQEYRTKHTQEISENNKKYRVKNRQRLLKISKHYYVENKQYFLEYYENNKQKTLKYKEEYLKTDKGKLAVNKYNHNRRTNISNSIKNLTVEEKNYILYNLQNNQCVRCGRTFNEELKPTLDHIIPVNKGGPLTKENVQFLCQSCNSKKHTKTIDYRPNIHKEMIGQNFGPSR